MFEPKKLLFFLFILSPYFCRGQGGVKDSLPSTLQVDTPSMEDVDVYIFYEAEADFPGGEKKLKNYLSQHVIYPAEAVQKNIVGTVIVSFVVRKDGRITNVNTIEHIANCPECDTEAIRLVKSMPNWTPAIAYGKFVSTTVEVPVKFK